MGQFRINFEDQRRGLFTARWMPKEPENNTDDNDNDTNDNLTLNDLIDSDKSHVEHLHLIRLNLG